MTVNKERVELWVAALESGDYEQTYGVLWNEEKTKFCAIGVAERVAAKAAPDVEYIDDAFWYGLPYDFQVKIGPDWIPVEVANDSLKMTFWEIAQALRETYLKD